MTRPAQHEQIRTEPADRSEHLRTTTVFIEALPVLLRETRRYRQINLRDAAAQIGVAFNSLSRIERGRPFNSRALLPILRWLAEEETRD